MKNTVFDKLRSLRRAELFAALAILAVLALLLLSRGTESAEEGKGKTALETRLEELLEGIDGAGRLDVMVSESEDGQVVGAVIVSNRPIPVSVRLDIQAAVTTLLGIDLEHVEIIGGHELTG